MKPELIAKVSAAVGKFVSWLDNFGEVSYDHQTFFAGPVGQKAKALYYKRPFLGRVAVAPMIFCEAFLPNARRFFWKAVRFPIADAHYAMGFAFLCRYPGDQHHQRAVHFLRCLEEARSPGFLEYCWGYPFDWVTGNGVIEHGTPMITSTPYGYEAFHEVHEIDHDEHWLSVCRSIAEHAITNIKDFETSSEGSSCSYTPDDRGGVVNASAYRACLLAKAAIDLSEDRYWRIGERNLNFVLEAQQPDGSWFYSVDGQRDFIDHFHTCFVLKALAKIQRLIPHEKCGNAIDRGVEYYLRHMFDVDGLPRPFSKAPRLTVYRRELYDYAECINLCLLLRDRIGDLQKTLETLVYDLLKRWVKKDGSFRSRELLVGWDNVPMHRWAQSQIFRSLALMLRQDAASGLQKSGPGVEDVRNLRAV
jgi:hypothetical protein